MSPEATCRTKEIELLNKDEEDWVYPREVENGFPTTSSPARLHLTAIKRGEKDTVGEGQDWAWMFLQS